MRFWLKLIVFVGDLLSFAIVADAVLSWVPYNENIYRIRNILQKVTYPVTAPIRKLLNPLTQRIMIDITPIVAIASIGFLQKFLIRFLLWMM